MFYDTIKTTNVDGVKKIMRKGKKIAVAKKATAAFLTAAMVTGMLPAGQIQNVMAADDAPYVISTGRMVYASSSVGNSDPAYAVD